MVGQLFQPAAHQFDMVVKVPIATALVSQGLLRLIQVKCGLQMTPFITK